MATTFTNQATLTMGAQQVLSNVAVGQIESALEITKTAVDSAYSPGEVITYIISVRNTGVATATGLTLTDNLGAYPFGAGTVTPLTYVDGSVQYYINGALQATPTVTTTDGLEITGLSIPADGNITVVYSAQVNEFAPPTDGGSIVNTVSLDGTGICAVTGEETVNAQSGAALSVTKSITPVPVAENGNVTYTLTIENNGNTPVLATDNAVISDTFTPSLSDITVTLDGQPLAATTGYTYNETTGAFATVAGVLTVDAASYTQDETTGAWSTAPGTATLVISGTIALNCAD